MATDLKTAVAVDGNILTRVAGAAAGITRRDLTGRINVRNHGAVGNGTTEDTTAIQAAITAAAAGDTVAFGGRTTYLTGQLTAKTGVILDLEGATLKLKNSLNGHGIIGTSLSDVTIRNGIIDGNKANQTSGSGIQLTSPTRCRFQDLRIINPNDSGIAIVNGLGVVIEGCHVESPGTGSGLNAGSGFYLYECTEMRVTHSRVVSPASCGIENVGACYQGVYTGNIITDATFLGIALASAGRGFTVADNYVSGSANNDIDGGNCTDVTIIGNVIANGASSGIMFDFGSTAGTPNANVSIVGNIITEVTAGYPAILLVGPAGGVNGFNVSDNQIDSVAGSGIAFHAVARSTIRGNTIRNWGPSYYGIALGGDAVTTGNIISQNIGWDDRATPTTKGIENYTTALGNVYADNDFSGCPDPFWNIPGDGDRAYGNAGWNPRGHAVAQPAVAATTVAVTNTIGVDCTVHVAGGTVTVIAVSGTATGLTSGSFRVLSGETITLTYSVAPTWEWFGD